VLEPDDRKLSRPVLRGPGPRNGVRLLDQWPLPDITQDSVRGCELGLAAVTISGN
jgi:hypothetical protein